MRRLTRSLCAVGVSIAALGAAAPPPAVPQLPVTPSTVQVTSSPDGDLHVALNLNIKLTGISPFATSGSLICSSAVQSHNSVATVVAAANGGTLSDQTYLMWFNPSNLAGQAWNKTFPLTFSRGTY